MLSRLFIAHAELQRKCILTSESSGCRRNGSDIARELILYMTAGLHASAALPLGKCPYASIAQETG